MKIFDFTSDQLDTLNLALDHYGSKAQIIKCIEEMSELTVELTNHLGETGKAFSITTMEEAGDVYITLWYILHLFDNANGGLMKKSIERKLNRLKKRIENEMGGTKE